MELRNRLRRDVGPVADQVNVGTVHGLCFRIMVRHYAWFGFSDSRLVVASKQDRKDLIKQALAAVGGSQSFAMKRLEQYGSDPTVAPDAVVNAYINLLRKENAVDYTIMVRQVLTAMVASVPWSEIEGQCRCLLVDEIQDADLTQLALYKAASPDRFLAVGDPLQAIYAWRGASPEGVDALAKTCVEYPLTVNFRSSEHIIDAANRFASRSLPTSLVQMSMKGVSRWGADAEIAAYQDDAGAGGIACAPAGSTAILARTNFMLEDWSHRLDAAGIKHRVSGRSERMIDDPGASEALAWLAWPEMPDAGLLLDRALGSAFPAVVRSKVRADAREAGVTVFDVAKTFPIMEKFYNGWDELDLDAKVARAFAVVGTDNGQAMAGIAALLERYKQATPPQHWTAGGFVNWLSSLDAHDDVGPDEPGIHLMTIHAAKGLEFDNVFVVGLGDDQLPWRGDQTDNMAEEARLFYVAITRPRNLLGLVLPPGQVRPSRFLRAVRSTGATA